MSSDLPRRNRFSVFGTKRPFFRPLRPALCRRPRPLFRPPRAFVINYITYITATRGIALPHISLYIYRYIYRYRVLPSALLLFDHAAGIYIRLRVLFPAARIRCFLHPGIAPRPVSFDMLLSGVCIACFALVRSRSRRRDIRLRVLFTAVRVCCCFPAKISHCRARSYLRCPAPYHGLSV